MTPFQYISVSALGLLLTVEVIRAFRGHGHGLARLLRSGTWIAAAVAIVKPDLTSVVARAVGIQRGADLVSYLAALMLLAVTFYGYACYCGLRSQVTALARHIAILTARQGDLPRMPD